MEQKPSLIHPMPIVTGQTMAEIDRVSIQERGIAGALLMERAGGGIARYFMHALDAGQLQNGVILCGKGNNGGDGFVIGRHLHLEGFSPHICLLGSSADLKGDAASNFQRAQDLGVSITECQDASTWRTFFEAHQDSHLWVDALLGTGAKGAPRGLMATVIPDVNQLPGERCRAAVDMPSGVDADSGAVEGDAFWAQVTLTMGLPKVGQVLPPGLDYCGHLRVLDIGFPADLIETAPAPAQWLTPKHIHQWLPVRKRSAHKGSQGHLLVIAGSRGMTGAALLCARAAIQMGAGLVTAVCPASQHPIYAQGVWEMLTHPVSETTGGAIASAAFEEIDWSRDYDAVVIGPGLGRDPDTEALVRRVVQTVQAPVLIDGDGLNALNGEQLSSRGHPWLATPHPGEMARLLGQSVPQVQADRFGSAKALVHEAAALILKGPCSVIASSSHCWINPTGGPAMASGGMGDVLAGMAGALLANGLAVEHAAAAATYLHGECANQAVERTGAEALAAGQLIDEIPHALSAVRAAGRSQAVLPGVHSMIEEIIAAT